MMKNEIDLFAIDRGHIVAPAGCGKTHLIATVLTQYTERKPILILTHTNAGVAALRHRLTRLGVKPSIYRLTTIDGWAIRLITTFPQRSGHRSEIIEGVKPNYSAIREAASSLLASGHIGNLIRASYARMFVDEYQDCSLRQHSIVKNAAEYLPTCVVGDPMQAIFGFNNDPLPDWHTEVNLAFPYIGELATPWRWINSQAESLGAWLLEVRKRLEEGSSIDLRESPEAVKWIELDGTSADHDKCLKAGRTTPPGGSGSVLILGESTNPDSQRRFASQTPGAITIEAVDIRDFIQFAQSLNLLGSGALEHVLRFAQSVMTGVRCEEFIRRVRVLTLGSARHEANSAEVAALTFQERRSHRALATLLHELSKQSNVRVFRPDILRACTQALQMCCVNLDLTFYEAALRVREQNRFQCRNLPRRAVGSTLLLKGLEADVAVILNADNLDACNLYVAMTRGSKLLVICSSSPIVGNRRSN